MIKIRRHKRNSERRPMEVTVEANYQLGHAEVGEFDELEEHNYSRT